jgi:hypothetical protein
VAACAWWGAKAPVAWATFPGRDGSLLLALNPAGGPEQLWLAGARGQTAHRILTGPACNADFFRAVISPSGRQIVFSESTSCFGTVGAHYTLVVVNLRGQRPRVIARFSSPLSPLAPAKPFFALPGSIALSPDGQTVAYGITEIAPKSALAVDLVNVRLGRITGFSSDPITRIPHPG